MPSEVIAKMVSHALDQPGLSPNAAKEVKASWKAVEDEETQQALKFVERGYAQFDEEVTKHEEAMHEFMKDALARLKEADERRIGSAELAQLRRDVLKAREWLMGNEGKKFLGVIKSLQGRLESTQEIEADPGAWRDDLCRKYPLLGEIRFNPRRDPTKTKIELPLEMPEFVRTAKQRR
jgi:hypothetical protein